MTTNEKTSNPDKSEPATVSKAVLVGHCGFDQSSLGRAVASALPGFVIESVNDRDALEQLATPDALLLINRVLDGRFGSGYGGSGIDLIAELATRDNPPRLILISNYPDAQAQAVAAGALPGFGKCDLGTPAATQALKQAANI